VSYQCGFSDVNYFVRTFKRSEGLTPGAYQASIGRPQRTTRSSGFSRDSSAPL
jgi:AraC-like DNA-binding protein